MNYINSKVIDIPTNEKEYCEDFERLNKLLVEGYYQQLLVEVLTNLPKKCYNLDTKEISKIKNTITYFINILLPDMKF